MKIKAGLATILFGVASASSAQAVINADATTAQATIRRDENGFVECGIRVIAQVLLPQHAETYDFSLNLNAKFFKGLLKAGQYTIPGNAAQGWDVKKRKAVLPEPKGFWFAEQSSDFPLKPDRLMKADDAGFVLGIAEFSPTAETIFAVVEGKPVQLALQYPSDRLDRIISFKVDMPLQDAETYSTCMDGLHRRMKREIEKYSQ